MQYADHLVCRFANIQHAARAATECLTYEYDDRTDAQGNDRLDEGLPEDNNWELKADESWDDNGKVKERWGLRERMSAN